MNSVRSTFYGDFASIGIEKEKARVAALGTEQSGDSVYNKMKEDIKK